MNDALTATLLALEEESWAALSSDRAAGFYREVLTEDALLVVPGMVLTREATIEAAGAALPWVSHRIEDAQAIQFAVGSALITYLATARRAGDEAPYVALMSTVWVQREGAWKLAFHQQTSQP